MSRFCAVAIFLTMASAVWAQDTETGQELYRKYCAMCHGQQATGNGPMAPVLVLQPPNLTALARENGGIFPRARVIARIDGRDPLISHGSPMPIYGDFFEGKGVTLRDETGVLVMTTQAIIELVMWLEDVQR